MARSRDEILQNASVESLAALDKLLTSDPSEVEKMTTEEVDEGLRMMNVSARTELPDGISALFNERSEALANRPSKKQISIGMIASAFGMFVVIGLFKFFRSRHQWIPICIAFTLGCVISAGFMSRVKDQKRFVLEKQSADGWARLQAELVKSNKEKENFRTAYVKLSGAKWYESIGKLEVNQILGLKPGTKKKDSKATKVDHFDDLALKAKQLINAGLLEIPMASRPAGLPVDKIELTRMSGSEASVLDLTVPPSSKVSATGGGVVIGNLRIPNQGSVVLVSHLDGVVTSYGPLAEVTVGVGATVESQKTLGYMANTGRSEALHYSVYKHGRIDSINSYLTKRDK